MLHATPSTSARRVAAPRCVGRALLVGINAYRLFETTPLRGCLNDVAAMRDFLVGARGLASRDITVLVDGEATRAAIVSALTALAAAAQPGEALVFYFCGHGAQLASADPRELDELDEVICPVDFDGTTSSAILDDELRVIFESIRAGVRVTWMFDACHSGDIDDGAAARCGATTAVRGAPLHATVHALRHRSRGVLITACASTERAADICVDGEAHGALSYYLLEAARQAPRASLRELLPAVRAELAAIGQHPEVFGQGLDAPFASSAFGEAL
jgi:metacaspase-1